MKPHKLAAVVAVLLICGQTKTLQSQDAPDACNLMPGNPRAYSRGSEGALGQFPPGACLGLYWPRVASYYFRDLSEFHTTIYIIPMPSAAAAAKNAARGPGDKYRRDASYGEGGVELIETPNAPDEPVATPEDVKQGPDRGMTTLELVGDVRSTNYDARFKCGRFFVHAEANPSRANDARGLLKELEANLKSKGYCGGSPAVVARNDPAPPPRIEESGGHRTASFEGAAAREIMNASKRNSRHVVVLNKEWDARQNCFVEERAWVTGIRVGGDDRVTIEVGPSKSFCVREAIQSADAVNQGQRVIAEARENLAKALEAEAKLEPRAREGSAEAIERWDPLESTCRHASLSIL